MTKRKRYKKGSGVLGSLKEETRHGVLSIIFFAFSLFFILASFDKSGVVGNTLFTWFDMLLGVGYVVLPLLSFMLGVSFFKNTRPHIAIMSSIGGGLFFLSFLGIVSLIFKEDSAGVIGGLISKPMLALFDFWISFIFLIAILIISFLVIFDTKPNFAKIHEWLSSFSIFKRKEVDDEDEYDEEEEETEEEEDEDEYDEEEEEDDEGADENEKEKGMLGKLLSGKNKKDDEEDFAPINPPHHSVPFTPPPLSLLAGDKGKPGVGDIKANANIIKRTLQNFGINVEMDEISVGPTVTRYALKPAEGVKLSRIVGLQNDLALALAAHPIRIEAPIPGKSLVGVEIPNTTRTTVGLKTLFSESEYKNSTKPLPLALGRSVSGKLHFADLAKMPHLLIAGATGAGKSVTIHTIINSLLFKNPPENLRFIMIDPKRVELTVYKNLPHLLTPVITDAKKTILSLKWAAKEMDRRYDILEAESVRDIASYHKNIFEPAMKKHQSVVDKGDISKDDDVDLPERMPYIAIVIDELADIMSMYPRELESAIVRLAQMSRAVGIHLILSTQRPSVNILTGLIKANIPARIALQVSSQIDSRTILDTGGAEKLLGAGDMLYLSGEMSKPVRIQSAFMSEAEVKNVVKYIIDTYESPGDEITLTSSEGRNSLFETALNEDDDELYEDAREIVISADKGSVSYLQRKLSVGYSRAARLMDMLEERGVVGPQDGSKAREILDKGPDYEDGE